MDQDERFEKIKSSVYQELLRANLHFTNFWKLYSAPKDIEKIRNVYLTFFVLTMRSHNDRFCISLHNVVKPDKDTGNFTKLFNYIKSNKHMHKIYDLRDIEKMQEKIESHTSLIERIGTIRDQYIAHNQLDTKHLTEPLTYEYPEGKALLIDLNKILQEISRKYDGLVYWHDDDGLLEIKPSLNVEDMLKHLTEHRKDDINSRISAVRKRKK